MWRFKNLMPKEQAVGLEGKAVEVGSLKLQVRSAIAQGGFSTVYLARDAASGKQYALKHIICNGNSETMALAKKEVEVMRGLRGHPNVVALHSHAVYGTRDYFLSMDLCEKSLVQVLDSSAFLNENQLLLAFRDVCNAVYAMHCQNPPIAHRDLKAENVLLGGDGQWKLCDFGSTSTNHKCFERADEMGIEEDNIRKHTTPAYRAPEMWDLYQRQVISEKVDIWALGCLLYRMAYLKSAFDGESKLQVLNGNYRIPDTPKYSMVVMGLIKDMLQLDPNTRPDVMQVWQRVNDALSPDCRKASPDKPPSYQAKVLDTYDSRSTKKPSAVPSRAPPPPPRDTDQHLKGADIRHSTHMKELDRKGLNSGGGGSPLSGSFWSTQYAQEIQVKKDSSSPASCERVGLAISPPMERNKSPEEHLSHSPPLRESPPAFKKSGVRNLLKKAGGRNPDLGNDGYEIRFDDEDVAEVETAPKGNSRGLFQKSGTDATKVHSTEEMFSAFVAEAQHSVDERDTGKEALQLELEKLKEELKLALTEKAEAVSKYEKLTAICRSQRQELQSLKSALAVSDSQSGMAFNHSLVSQSPPPKASEQSPQSLPEDWQTAHQIGTIWDLEDGFSSKGSGKEASPETQTWQAFPKSPSPAFKESYDDPIFDSPKDDRHNQQHARAASFALGDNGGGFTQDNLSNNTLFGDNFSPTKPAGKAQSSSRLHASVRTHRAFNSKSEKTASIPAPSKSQPAGWAGF